MTINAEGLHYRRLNEMVREAVARGERELTLENVCGQRYIGCALDHGTRLAIRGVPGNDLACFLNGAELVVAGNAQDGVGNTMNAGKIVIHGDAGDIVGHAMRGGRIFVRSRVGYRAGIHMKAYRERFPVVVIGRCAGDYLGEYMAGGVLVVLGLDNDRPSPAGRHIGTGMHGGVIYLRGNVEAHQLGREVRAGRLDDDGWPGLSAVLAEYCRDFDLDPAVFQPADFLQLTPHSTRPYGTLYAY